MDGGSTDRTVEIAHSMSAIHPNLRVVPNPKRIQSAAINLAARIADPRATALLQADAHALYPLASSKPASWAGTTTRRSPTSRTPSSTAATLTEHRKQVRQQRSRPLVEAMHAWLAGLLGRLSGRSTLAQAIRYALNHWKGLIRFLDDGRFELDTNMSNAPCAPSL